MVSMTVSRGLMSPTVSSHRKGHPVTMGTDDDDT